MPIQRQQKKQVFCTSPHSMAQGIGGWERVPGLDWMARFFMSGPPPPHPPPPPSIFQMGNQGRDQLVSSAYSTQIFNPLNLIKSSNKCRTYSISSVAPCDHLFFVFVLSYEKKRCNISWTVLLKCNVIHVILYLTILSAISHVRISVSWFSPF